MRVVINQALLDRYRRISHVLFFVSLAGMGIGFFYTWTSSPESSANQLSCLILPILLLMTLTSVRMANTWIREPRPVNVLSEAFKGLGKKYTAFHHVLPAPHVLIGPEGVFTLKTVWQDRPYRIEGKKWYGDQGLMRKLNGYLRQDLIGNPFQEAQFEAQEVQKIVDKVAPDSGVEVLPLIVFINSNAQFEADDPLIPVLYADSKKKPSLRSYLRDVKNENRATLSDEHLDKIDRMFGLATRQDISELLEGQTLDEAADEDVAEGAVEAVPAAAALAGADSKVGTIIIAQSGQLYYIGTASDTVEAELEKLRASAPQAEIELVHSFETANPSSTESALRRKFAPKRQKDNWYGLSRKDVTWLKSRRDQS